MFFIKIFFTFFFIALVGCSNFTKVKTENKTQEKIFVAKKPQRQFVKTKLDISEIINESKKKCMLVKNFENCHAQQILNQYRSQNGLSAVTIDEGLSKNIKNWFNTKKILSYSSSKYRTNSLESIYSVAKDGASSCNKNDFIEAMSYWYSQNKDYDRMTKLCKFGKVCYDYTNIINPKVHSVGCAAVYVSSYQHGNCLIACQYGLKQ